MSNTIKWACFSKSRVESGVYLDFVPAFQADEAAKIRREEDLPPDVVIENYFDAGVTVFKSSLLTKPVHPATVYSRHRYINFDFTSVAEAFFEAEKLFAEMNPDLYLEAVLRRKS